MAGLSTAYFLSNKFNFKNIKKSSNQFQPCSLTSRFFKKKNKYIYILINLNLIFFIKIF